MILRSILLAAALAAPAAAQTDARRQAERALCEKVVEIPTVEGRGQMPKLTALLTGGGHRVIPLVRPGSTSFGQRGASIAWDPAAGSLDPEDLRQADVVVNLAGESIGGRMTPQRQVTMVDANQAGRGCGDGPGQ